MTALDASITRPLQGGPSFDRKNRIVRILWSVTWFLFASWTPPQFRSWRRFLLRSFGAKVADTADVYSSVKIWLPSNLEMAEYAGLGPRVNCYCMDKIVLEPYASVSQGAFLCAGSHQVDDPNFQLVTKPIVIEEGAWVAAEAFVGPGVRIGKWAVLGARGVAFSDLHPSTIYVGNPARPIRKRIVQSRSELNTTSDPPHR